MIIMGILMMLMDITLSIILEKLFLKTTEHTLLVQLEQEIIMVKVFVVSQEVMDKQTQE